MIIPKIADRVQETTNVEGMLGEIYLEGAKIGYIPFSQLFSTGDVVYYAVVSGSAFEIGSGVFDKAGPQPFINRDTILFASTGTPPYENVNFSAGVKDVFCTAPAAFLTNLKLLLTSSVDIFVGADGDYPTITEALKALTRFSPVCDPTFPVSATIHLVSGFVMAETLHVVNIDLGWIEIVSADPVVNIDATALSSLTLPYFGTARAVFAGEEATLPKISTLFNMVGPYSDTPYFIWCIHSSCTISPGCGCTTAAAGNHRGVAGKGSSIMAFQAKVSGSSDFGIMADGGIVSCDYAELTDNDTGIAAFNAAQVSAYAANLSGSLSKAVSVSGSVTICDQAILTNCNNIGISAAGAAMVNAGGVVATSCSTGFEVYAGATISAHYSTGTLSQTKNTITAEGIIFQEA